MLNNVTMSEMINIVEAVYNITATFCVSFHIVWKANLHFTLRNMDPRDVDFIADQKYLTIALKTDADN